MNNYFLWVVLPNLSCFLGIFGIIGIISCIVGVIISIVMDENACDKEDKKKAKKVRESSINVLIGSIIMIFITCFIPEKKDLMQLKALSILSEVKGADKIPQKLIDKLNDLLEVEK